MVSATSGDSRDLSGLFGKGRMGLSGYIGEVVSEEWPVGEGGEYGVPVRHEQACVSGAIDHIHNFEISRHDHSLSVLEDCKYAGAQA